jgi:hypothetical protein
MSVLFASCLVAGGGDPAEEALAALRAVAGRIEFLPAGAVALGDWSSAAGAVKVFHQITLESTPIGMRRSSSICRSCWGSRPKVVR